MENMSSKLQRLLKNLKQELKSDAVPQPPRSEHVEDNIPQEQEQPVDEQDDIKKSKKKPKEKFPFNFKKKKGFFVDSSDIPDNQNHFINTQATGNVINIVNAKGFHWGDQYNYDIGLNEKGLINNNKSYNEVEKCDLINTVLNAKIRPEHQYIDYISKNLGKNWHSFFRTLGYSTGFIETMEIDNAKNGVAEARYKLLLDWARNDIDGTLGRLATYLWEDGEKNIVKQLAIMYKTEFNM